jgi:hypothetical protein
MKFHIVLGYIKETRRQNYIRTVHKFLSKFCFGTDNPD